MAYPAGTLFAGFTIDRVLGTGGMGTVYLARHPRLPRWDALKLMSADLSGDPGFKVRFEREADLAAQLHHRNIVTVYDRGCTDDQLWIDMQYVAGTDCSEVLKDGPLSAERAVHVVREVGIALDYAHAGGLLHRDVKPANILLAPSRHAEDLEQVLLMDFGIAKAINEAVKLTSVGDLLLTPDYAAPEQIRLERLDHRVDVYALGCVLYELLTGTVPYPSHYRALTLEAHLSQPPPRPSAVLPALPPGLDFVIAKAMAKQREHRYANCADLVKEAAAAIRPPDPLPQAAMVPAATVRAEPRTPKVVRRFVTGLVAIASLAAAFVVPSEKSQILTALSLPMPESAALPVEHLVAALEIEGNVDLYIVDSGSGAVLERLTTSTADDRGPSISPDRQSIIYTQLTAEQQTLRVMAADGSGDRELFPREPQGCLQMDRPGWSRAQPDLLAIVCVNDAGRQLLRVIRTNGQVVHTFDVKRAYLADPTFSPDGATIAFAASGVAASNGGALYTIATDGNGELQRLTTAPAGSDNGPAWSPDGTEIVFRRRIDDGSTGGNFEIYAVGVADRVERPIAEHEGRDGNPGWSPDGELITFMSERDGLSYTDNISHAWVVGVEGGKPRQLIQDGGQSVAWTTR